VTTEAIETVQLLLERGIRAGSAPGMVAAWRSTTDRKPSTVAVGRASVNPASTPSAPETWFDLASLTKPLVVGTLTLLFMRDGALAPDTAVGEVLPEASRTPVGARLVRQVLTHSSGLPAWEPLYTLAGGIAGGALGALIGVTIEEPDTHVVYSCPGFILLGMMIEKVAGAGLAEIFTERVIEPLGLGSEIGYRPGLNLPLAGGATAPAAEQRLLAERGLESDHIPAILPGQPDDGNSRFLDSVAGNAGLFGTARGVLALAMVYLGVGEFLTPEEIELATTDHTPGLEQRRGFGWQLAGSPGCSAGPALDPSAFGHTGFTGTSLWIDPTRDLAMTLLANRVHPGHRATDLHPLRRRFHQLVID
jgi:CubicO group peptidase (beta-lactamase class C family)